VGKFGRVNRQRVGVRQRPDFDVNKGFEGIFSMIGNFVDSIDRFLGFPRWLCLLSLVSFYDSGGVMVT
jgi:hypothetical protein